MAAASWVMAAPRPLRGRRSGPPGLGRLLGRGRPDPSRCRRRCPAGPRPATCRCRRPRRSASGGGDEHDEAGSPMSARDEVLGRIRAALAATAARRPPDRRRDRGLPATAHAGPAELLDLFAERLTDYRATRTAVHRRRRSPPRSSRRCRPGRGAWSCRPASTCRLAGRTVERVDRRRQLSRAADLDAFDGVVTAAAVGDRRDRHHRPRRVAGPGPAGDHPGARLPPVRGPRPTRSSRRCRRRSPRLRPDRPLTLISGPSRHQRHRAEPGRRRARPAHPGGHPDRPAEPVKAVSYSAYRATPALTDVPEPGCPPDGVVIAVGATGVCRSDWHAWQGHDPVGCRTSRARAGRDGRARPGQR